MTCIGTAVIGSIVPACKVRDLGGKLFGKTLSQMQRSGFD